MGTQGKGMCPGPLLHLTLTFPYGLIFCHEDGTSMFLVKRRYLRSVVFKQVLVYQTSRCLTFYKISIFRILSLVNAFSESVT
jgi:hypothetical protein